MSPAGREDNQGEERRSVEAYIEGQFANAPAAGPLIAGRTPSGEDSSLWFR